MKRKYANLSAVWLPPGWLWLDDRWELDTTVVDVDTAGWQFATGWTTGWSGELTPLAFVRRRRWVRERCRASDMTRATAGRLTDGAVGHLSADSLKLVIGLAGMVLDERISAAGLTDSARKARDLMRSQPGPAGEEPKEGTAPPLMPPVQLQHQLELQLPGEQDESCSHGTSSS